MTSPTQAQISGKSGFTLIEVLVVVAIAAMVMSLATVGLASIATASSLARTTSGLAHMDASARMHARASAESVILEFDVEDRVARLVGDRSPIQLAQIDIPFEIGLTINLPQAAKSVRFDRRGTSDDYAIELRSSTRAIRLAIAGLTGEIVESEVIQ